MDLTEVIFLMSSGRVELYVKEEQAPTDKKVGDVDSQEEAQLLSLYLKLRMSTDIYDEQMSVRIYELLVVGVAKRLKINPNEWGKIRFRMDPYSKNGQIIVLASDT